MTTVAFVTYKFQGAERRIGPLSAEMAQTLAKDTARRSGTTDVTLEEWTCSKVTTVPGQK